MRKGERTGERGVYRWGKRDTDGTGRSAASLPRLAQHKAAKICAVVPDTERLGSTKGRGAKGKGMLGSWQSTKTTYLGVNGSIDFDQL